MIVRTEEEMQSTIALINERMQEPAMKQPANAEVEAGCKEALRILHERDETLEHIVTNCTSVQARCIAWLAVDYLQGECEQRVLCDIPIKPLEEEQRSE